ncbi:hypothetical protein [Campylobacter sp. VTCC 70190]|uniref:hypothetical protein n=1 Tax=Campylobacter sp. VTCC 70190 TaxID=3392118 RepID=UPI00398E94FF
MYVSNNTNAIHPLGTKTEKSANTDFQKTLDEVQNSNWDIDKLNPKNLANDNFSKISKALDNIINPKTGEKVSLDLLSENEQRNLATFAADYLYMFQNDFKTQDINVKIELEPQSMKALVYFEDKQGRVLDLLKNMGLEKAGIDTTQFLKMERSLKSTNNDDEPLISYEGGAMFIDPKLIDNPFLEFELVDGKLSENLKDKTNQTEELDLRKLRSDGASLHYKNYVQTMDRLVDNLLETQYKNAGVV